MRKYFYREVCVGGVGGRGLFTVHSKVGEGNQEEVTGKNPLTVWRSEVNKGVNM